VRRQKNINFQIKTLPTPRRRIKPVHGLWLIARETITTPPMARIR
jgi:hypothetical protein